MPVIDTMLRRIVRGGPNPALQETSDWTWPLRSVTGQTVSDQTSLSLTAFYRGVSLIASTVAGLPFHVQQESPDGSTEQIHTPETSYLWLEPNPEMTRQAFWERVVADEVRGNAFVWVEKDDSGSPSELWHIPRGMVRVGRTKSGVKVYEIGDDAYIDYRQGGTILHIPNWGDSLVGYDPMRLAAQSIALGLSAEEYAARLFGQGLQTAMIVTSDQVISPEESERISIRMSQLYGGVRNAGKFPVLGAGARMQPIALEPEKAQMQELRGFQVTEIARLLGVPPHLLGDVERSTSWGAGIAEQDLAFYKYGLQPHIGRLEAAIDTALLVRGLTGRRIKIDPRGFLKAAHLQRMQGYKMADFMTDNEKRALEDLPPIEGGDVLRKPINTAPVEAFEGMQLGQGGEQSRA